MDYQPEMWTVRKDYIYVAIEAIQARLEYTVDMLTYHDISLGRTTRKNKHTAEAMERDINKMKSALEDLRKDPANL